MTVAKIMNNNTDSSSDSLKFVLLQQLACAFHTATRPDEKVLQSNGIDLTKDGDVSKLSSKI